MPTRLPPRTPPTPLFEPPLERWPAAGVYQVWLRVPAALHLRIGRLGRFDFPPGLYVYTGRAARGLKARVLRHAHGGRRQHWHIDYLLHRLAVRIVRITLASANPNDECRVNRATARTARPVAPGFGASDCGEGCSSHLLLAESESVMKAPSLPRLHRQQRRPDDPRFTIQ
jgi:Uri superfamily endonuclease